MALKRFFDIGASALGVTILSPFLAALALAGAAHFRGNPFHLAQRVGKDGKPFLMLKFRSMQDGEGNDEERTTRYGHIIRATALDELPQLFNILKGDMSFVGPRPRAPATEGYDAIPEDFKDIISVRPGLTGPWQIAAIGRMTPITSEEKLNIEVDYARRTPSLSRDFAIILKTLPAFIHGHDGESLRKTADKVDLKP